MSILNRSFLGVRCLQLALGLGCLAGCGGSDGSGGAAGTHASGSAGSGSGNDKGTSCGLVSAAEASSTLGVANLQAPVSTVNGIVTLCQYSDGKNALSVQIRYQTSTDAAEFMQGKDGFAMNSLPTMDVAGLGDAAYSSVVGSGSFMVNTIVCLSGSVEVEITSSASLDKIETLVRAIIPKL